MNLLTAQSLGVWERSVCAPCPPPPHQGLLGFALFSGRLEDVVFGLDAQTGAFDPGAPVLPAPPPPGP